MANKRRKALENAPDAFTRQEQESTSAADRADIYKLDAAVYGSSELFSGLARADSQRQVAEAISIFDIFPDPGQPRRVIPTEIRQHWDGQPTSIPQMLRTWQQQANEERGDAAIDLDAYILGNETERFISGEETDSHKPGPLEASYLMVLELAASIWRDGLTNPITVVDQGLTYRLETGERRWLAYHLLHDWAQTNGKDNPDKYTRILATRVKEINVWRQASENNARADLNAISKARQFAILLMDLLQHEKGEQFQLYDAVISTGGSEREYYAQVEDGSRYAIPRNKGELLLNAMGLKNGKQLKQHRALLRLPDVVWQIADDLNWAEGKLRTLAKLVNDGLTQQAIQKACQMARQEGYRGPIGPLCDDAAPKKREANSAENSRKAVNRIEDRVRAITALKADDAAKYDKEHKQTLRLLLRELQEWIDEIKPVVD